MLNQINFSKYMRRFVVFLLIIVLLGCSEQEAFEQAVLEQMQNEKDIKDYNIDPQSMTACVVSETMAKMPGINGLDPIRRQALIDYTAMLTLPKSKDPAKTLDDLRKTFGSAKGLADAHSNYSEAVVNCLSSLVSKSEEELP